MKSEKIALWSFVLALLSFGCNSSRTDYTPATILEHQRKIAELEATITRIDNIMQDATDGLAEITNRGCAMEDEIDGVIREFNAYQSRVERLLREYNALRNAEKTSAKGFADSAFNSVDSNAY